MYLAVLLSLLCAVPCFGVLSPFHERIREMESILLTDDLSDMVESEPVESLSYEPNDTYKITTKSYSVTVHVHYAPASQIGPVDYRLEFDKPLLRQ